MEIIVRAIIRVIVFPVVVGMAAGCGLAQESAPVKHVRDIAAEQTEGVIVASALCQRVRASGHSLTHSPQVDPATLETDLAALMQKSDDVVLVSYFRNQMTALSPSGEDVISYHDVIVLRSWKGSYKVGDLLTYAEPLGAVICEPRPYHSSSLTAWTTTGGDNWDGPGSPGPTILFLRQSQGNEKQLLPGLRLTGGDGLQGLFIVQSPWTDKCSGARPDDMSKCSAALDASQAPIKIRYRLDPLKRKYEGIAASSFLKEIQSAADSSGG
ncbi:MAG: hypothetical protein OK436_07420 [Thaumarchaeota archaeon]|nr:hypothetical protein [Nitrososphaerota archaeon]